MFFWKKELEITNLLEKEHWKYSSRFIEFGRIHEAEKHHTKLFARMYKKEHANIYSLYNVVIQLFFCLSGTTSGYNRCQVPAEKGGYFLFDFLRLICIKFHTSG